MTSASTSSWLAAARRPRRGPLLSASAMAHKYRRPPFPPRPRAAPFGCAPLPPATDEARAGANRRRGTGAGIIARVRDGALITRFGRARRDPSLAVLEGFHPLKHALRFGAELLEVVCREEDELD